MDILTKPGNLSGAEPKHEPNDSELGQNQRDSPLGGGYELG